MLKTSEIFKHSFENVSHVKLSDSIRPELTIFFGKDEKQIFKDFSRLHFQQFGKKGLRMEFFDIIDLGIKPSKSIYLDIGNSIQTCDIYIQQHKIKIECRE